jgi:hypothetical protein
MDSVIIEKDDQTSSTICIVEILSEELKKIIRKQLSSICQGATRGESGKKIYSYHNTLSEYLTRYETKTEEIKKGIIGELISHVLFIEFFNEFQIISPLFNLEERSIKKSFDLLLFHSSQEMLYYTEVKSGTANSERSDDKNISLLGIAKNDIHRKLNDNNDNNWLNAINGATISLEKKNIKNEVTKILESCLEDSQDGNSESRDKSVILVSVTYNSILDKITLSRVTDYSTKNMKDFSRCIFFSIQNDTYQSIEAFLKDEIANGN